MDKLIELLNEYSVVLWDRYSWVTWEEYPKKWSYGITWPDNPWRYIFYSDNTNLSQTYLISKEYWFIKWLVDNDKIDLSSRNALFISEDAENWEKQRPYSFYEEMLIRLAISDTPIEDLISYLK